uniref:Uncharacterized protein n=1 Tax=Rhizophora mucronata TaxID=61149 RepID=A0A2P2NB75_RHIMU
MLSSSMNEAQGVNLRCNINRCNLQRLNSFRDR